MGVVDNTLQAISTIWHNLFGSSKLRHYEETCLLAWAGLLPTELQEKLETQLDKFSLIQRHASGLKSVFYDVKDSEYFSWGDEVLFPVREQGLKAFSGVLIAQEEDVQMKIKFEIFLHRGRLSSIEFESTPELMEKFNALEVGNPKILFDF